MEGEYNNEMGSRRKERKSIREVNSGQGKQQNVKAQNAIQRTEGREINNHKLSESIIECQ